MTEPSRYNVTQKGADLQEQILKNKLGIKDRKTLEDTETILLQDAYQYFFALLEKHDLKFNIDLLFKIHEYFLAPLYKWAGTLRKINISKDGVMFAPAHHLENSMQEFKKILEEQQPLQKNSKSEIAQKLAIIHCEFNAIHPFREGNGRTIRLFLDLLTVSIGYNPLDFGKLDKTRYVNACIKGMSKNYDAMKKIMYKALKKNQ